MDLSGINNITDLKVLLADEFIRREQAAAIHQQSVNNINLLQQKISDLQMQQAQARMEVAEKPAPERKHSKS